MTFKTTVWLFVLVCLFGLLIWVSEHYVDSTGERLNRNVRLLSVDPAKATMVELATADFHAVCVKEDDTWHIRRPLIGRADASRIERMLAALESMRRIETITMDQRLSRELSLEDYGLAKPAATLIVRDESRRQEIWIGAGASPGEEVYVKLATSDDVLATQSAILNELPATIEDMRDRALFSDEAFRTARLEIRRTETGFTQLARTDGTWVIQQPLQANADDAKIEEMLSVLYSARIRRFVWDEPAEPSAAQAAASATDGNIVPRAEAYGLVPDDAARIAVWMAGSDAGTELLLGKTASETDGEEPGETYAKFRDSDSIFTVDEALHETFSVDPVDLRDRNLFTLKAEEVRFVSLRKGEEKLVLQRMDDSGWMIMEPVQWEADDEIVSEFVRRVSRLRAEVFLKGPATNLPAFGLSPPDLVMSIDSQPVEAANGPGVAPAVEAAPPVSAVGGGRGLCIGSLAEDAKDLYARFEDEDALLTISAAAVDGLGVRPTDPLVYRDRRMLAVAPDSIKRIAVAVGDREETIARLPDGQWSSEDEAGTNKVDMAVLNGLLLHMADLRAVSIDSHNPENLSAYGLDPAGVTLTLGLSGEEGIQKKVLMGFRAGTAGIYAMVQGQDVVFVLPDRTFTDLTRSLERDIEE